MTDLTRRHPSASLIISTLALVVALGGTTYAAVKLPKNSVGSSQVKNGSLKPNDLKKGAADPAMIIADTNDALVPIDAVINDPTLTTVRTLDLPAGKYYVEASVFVVNLSAALQAEPRCYLVSSGTQVARGTSGFYAPIQPDSGTNIDRAQFQLDAAYSFNQAGTVRVECNKQAVGQVMQAGSSMTATRIGSVKGLDG